MKKRDGWSEEVPNLVDFDSSGMMRKVGIDLDKGRTTKGQSSLLWRDYVIGWDKNTGKKKLMQEKGNNAGKG